MCRESIPHAKRPEICPIPKEASRSSAPNSSRRYVPYPYYLRQRFPHLSWPWSHRRLNGMNSDHPPADMMKLQTYNYDVFFAEMAPAPPLLGISMKKKKIPPRAEEKLPEDLYPVDVRNDHDEKVPPSTSNIGDAPGIKKYMTMNFKTSLFRATSPLMRVRCWKPF